ncbi:hypothetical protein V1525DRAFT_403066 [Lipomyces kononenkoae]|uniref:Uncharacterized protein n=1 Tax=Lipomyces kononenkoae TaxID=34357 RepID=A0ACC3T1Q4_LIPKO
MAFLKIFFFLLSVCSLVAAVSDTAVMDHIDLLKSHPAVKVMEAQFFPGNLKNHTGDLAQGEYTVIEGTKTLVTNKRNDEHNLIRRTEPKISGNKTGIMVFYKSHAEKNGGSYKPDAGGNEVLFVDDITYPELAPPDISHEKRWIDNNRYMQMNFYWDWWGNNYAASWYQNFPYCAFEGVTWGWNSYLGCVGMVWFPNRCMDTISDAWNNAIGSNSNCPIWNRVNNGENGIGDPNWCMGVGYTPNQISAFVTACDSGGIGNYGQ